VPESVFDADGVESGQEDWAEVGDKASGVDGGILGSERLCCFEVLGAEDDDAGHVVRGVLHVAECGACEDDSSGLGVLADEGEVLRHEVFVALGDDVPLWAFAEEAEEVGLELAGDIDHTGSLGVFWHVSIMAQGCIWNSVVAGVDVALSVVSVMAPIVIWDEAVAGEAGDAEVSAEVEKVEGTEGSVDDDEVNVGGVGDEQHHTLDVGVREADPEVGGAGSVGLGAGVSGDEMVPAAVMVLGADVGEHFRAVESGLGVSVNVHGDAAEPGDDALGLVVSGEVAGEAEHLAVEGEVGMEAGVLVEGVHAAREPVIVGVGGWIAGV
jgi:hypothetical protein